jgi:hypothetical protein
MHVLATHDQFKTHTFCFLTTEYFRPSCLRDKTQLTEFVLLLDQPTVRDSNISNVLQKYFLMTNLIKICPSTTDLFCPFCNKGLTPNMIHSGLSPFYKTATNTNTLYLLFYGALGHYQAVASSIHYSLIYTTNFTCLEVIFHNFCHRTKMEMWILHHQFCMLHSH